MRYPVPLKGCAWYNAGCKCSRAVHGDDLYCYPDGRNISGPPASRIARRVEAGINCALLVVVNSYPHHIPDLLDMNAADVYVLVAFANLQKCFRIRARVCCCA